MPVVPFSKTGTAPEDDTWDWSAATQNAILGEDGENWAEYKRAHAWWEGGSDTEKKAAYKLPHHKLVNGKLSAVWHGVANAMARLKQSDIPEGDMKPVFDHLAKHYAQWDKDPPEWDRFVAEVRERRRLARGRAASLVTARAPLPLVATRAPIRSLSMTEARPGGMPNTDDLSRINQLARTPLQVPEVYVFPSEITSEAVDAYFTRMTKKSLTQFAQDATRGVAVCDSHEHLKLPIGRSYYGTMAESQGGGQATHSLAYLIRGMPTSSGLNADDYIRGIEGGVYSDVSIGFIPDRFWCSICGSDMLNSRDCNHWPGQTYTVRDPNSGGESEQQCIADVDARLGEYSPVYDGATPNAMILKAEREIEAGRATPRMLAFVEDRCRAALYKRYPGWGQGRGWPVSSSAQAAASQDDEEEDEMQGHEVFRSYLTALTRAGKQLSAQNAGELKAMQIEAEAHHENVGKALDRLAQWIAEKSDTGHEPGEPGEDTDQKGGKNPAEGEDGKPGRATQNAHARVKTKGKAPAPTSAGKGHGEKPNGTGPNPDDEDGNGESDEDDAYSTSDGESTDGQDEDDAHDPDLNDALEPGTDDGDGDEDEPPDIDEDDPDGHEQGTDKSKKKQKNPASGTGATGQGKGKGRAASFPVLTFEQEAARREHAEFVALGRKLKAEALADALKAGVRALGVQFDVARYRPLLERASYEELARFRDDWQAVAKATLSPIGQFTFDRTKPGGGTFDDKPTGEGGRQTQARDPNNPAALRNATGWKDQLGGGQVGAAGLYTVGRGKKKPAGRK